MADTTLRARYEAVVESRDMPVFALTIADFFNPPAITNIDVSTYAGQAGNPITIRALDDFGVAKVHLSITDQNGQEIENGDAMEAGDGAGLWIYHVTQTVAAGTTVIVNVYATDHPGSTAVDIRTKTL